MKHTIASIALLSTLTAFANDADDAHLLAGVIANVLEVSATLSDVPFSCEARRQSKTIACTGDIPDQELGMMAASIVRATNRSQIHLPGWRLTITNPSGFVATHSYQMVEH